MRFRFAAGTSRGVLTEKVTHFVRLYDPAQPQREGWGECAPLSGLSPDHRPDLPERLAATCQQLAQSADPAGFIANLSPEWPAVRFAFEMAHRDWQRGGTRELFDTAFSRGEQPLPINGLIWMGDRAFMEQQIDEKLDAGYTCLKLKIGALDFETECDVLRRIRARYAPTDLTLRVDANGAFSPADAPQKLARLAAWHLHSIEQPIAAGQPAALAELCATSPLPIALDEDLIGVTAPKQQARLLDTVRPPYLILKPTLLGGWAASRTWIDLAQARGIGWWVTSALESNVGLNAIAQFTATYDVQLPQGLGTGQLYEQNVASPLQVRPGYLHHDPAQRWGKLPA